MTGASPGFLAAAWMIAFAAPNRSTRRRVTLMRSLSPPPVMHQGDVHLQRVAGLGEHKHPPDHRRPFKAASHELKRLPQAGFEHAVFGDNVTNKGLPNRHFQ